MNVVPCAAGQHAEERQAAQGGTCNVKQVVDTCAKPLTVVPAMVPARVALREVRRFITDCIAKAGACQEHAAIMAELLVAADHRGHFSHGLNRLEMYVGDLQRRTCDGNVTPYIINQTPATAWVDGRNGLGPVVGNFCMNLAIQKARETGMGFVAAKGSNHFGIAGWYTIKAAENGMIGFCTSNTSPLMSPTRAKTAALGTNPISVAALAGSDDSFVLDMATTAVALGKIELQRRKEEPIPEGWAQDADGQTTTDPEVALSPNSTLMPLGGAEHTSGYKGFGLALLVEVLSGVLAGSTTGPDVRKWMSDEERPADIGHSFFAIDTRNFAPNFSGRLKSLMDKMRSLEPTCSDRPVLVAGDPERAHMALVNCAGGITYHANQLSAADELACKLFVQPMERF